MRIANDFDINRTTQGKVVNAGGAHGVVLAVVENSVRCEFLHGERSQMVWLPRGLFPTSLEVGFTFTLTMDSEEGHRTPRVLPRKASIDQESLSRLEDLLARFG